MSEWNEITRDFDPATNLANIEAEQALLGAILINNAAFEHVADIVSPDDFTGAGHPALWREIAERIGNGVRADPVVLRGFAERLFTERGARYLVDLAAACVTIINAPHYAQTIRDLARRRELVFAAQDIVADASNVAANRNADDVLDEAEQRLYEISERGVRHGAPRKIGDVIDTVLDDIAAAYRAGGRVTLDTGLDDLDRMIAGMSAGELIVMAGRPSMGKSAAAGTIAFNLARAGKRVLMFSLEMSRHELVQRWIACLTGISTDDQRLGRIANDAQWQALAEAQAVLSRLPIHIDDQARLSVPQMRQRARRLKRRSGLDLIIVDHLQLVRQGGKQENRRLEIGDASGMLKAIAKELGVPVLLLSQLSRAVEQRDDKRPMLSDLRESGDIEQDADVVIFLYREEYYLARAEPKRKGAESAEAFAGRIADHDEQMRGVRGLAELIVAKNRHGRVGTVKAYFDAPRQRFENLAR